MAGLDRDYLSELQSLFECILKYSEIHKNISEKIDSAKESVEGLCEAGWQGESKDSFNETFNTWINDANAFNDNLEQLENALKVMFEKETELKAEGGQLLNFL